MKTQNSYTSHLSSNSKLKTRNSPKLKGDREDGKPKQNAPAGQLEGTIKGVCGKGLHGITEQGLEFGNASIPVDPTDLYVQSNGIGTLTPARIWARVLGGIA